MTWKSHIAIAVATTLPFHSELIPFAVLGSTAPDWSEWVLSFFGINVRHRGATHYLYIPFLIILSGTFISPFITWFGVGYLTHWFADSLTISGVPISQQDTHRIHFFGGKIRTGEPLEYIVAFGFLSVIVGAVQPQLEDFKDDNQDSGYEVFNPYFIQFHKLYDDGIIDEKQLRDNKFKMF